MFNILITITIGQAHSGKVVINRPFIDSTRHLLTCMRYIEMNPVRANGMVKHPKDYTWSSFGYNALGKENALVTENKIYTKLGFSENERQKAYRNLFRHDTR